MHVSAYRRYPYCPVAVSVLIHERLRPLFSYHRDLRSSVAKACAYLRVKREHGAIALRGSGWSTASFYYSVSMRKGLCQKQIFGPGYNPSLIECLIGCWLSQFLPEEIPWHVIAITQITLNGLSLTMLDSIPEKSRASCSTSSNL